MNNISDVLLLPERFSQDLLETYFCKEHPLGARIDKLLYNYGYANIFRNQKYSSQIATGKVRDENINFDSDRTNSIPAGQKKYKQKIQDSSSHQIPSYQTYTTSKLNEYINKLTLFQFFCPPFHIPFFYNIFEHLFCYGKLFQLYMKKVLALNLLLPSLFSNV